jgi:hypothetical protein
MLAPDTTTHHHHDYDHQRILLQDEALARVLSVALPFE